MSDACASAIQQQTADEEGTRAQPLPAAAPATDLVVSASSCSSAVHNETPTCMDFMMSPIPGWEAYWPSILPAPPTKRITPCTALVVLLGVLLLQDMRHRSVVKVANDW